MPRHVDDGAFLMPIEVELLDEGWDDLPEPSAIEEWADLED